MKRLRRIKTWCLIASAMMMSYGAWAQEAVPTKRMTLEECIRYAQANNITIKQQSLNVAAQDRNVASAYHQFLPTANGSVSQGWSFGRSQDKRGVYIDQSSASTSFNVGAGIELFTGMRRLHMLRAAKLDWQASLANMQQAQENLALMVAQNYINLLFQQELTKVAALQINQTQRQIEQAQAMVDAGRWAKSKVVELQAQLAKEELSFVDAQNNEQMARLELAQSMEMKQDTLPEVVTPDLATLLIENRRQLLDQKETYTLAAARRPSIRAAELNMASAEEQVKVAQSGFYPTLSFNTGYSNSYFKPLGQEMQAMSISFAEQMKQNGRSFVGISLNIPLFNRLETINSIKLRQLQVENNRLQLENEKKELLKQVSQAYYNALGANKKIGATEKAVESAQLAYEYADERLKANQISVFEFAQAKTNLMLSQAEALRAKYDFIFKSKVLEFYRGINF